MTAEAPPRMSHTRAKVYAECGEKYRQLYVEGVPELPSVAQAGGSAFHVWTQELDQGRVEKHNSHYHPDFAELFEEELAKLEQESGVPRQEFRIYGRKTKDRPLGEDVTVWAEELGPELCTTYANFRWPEGWELLEIERRIELTDPLWHGYLDRIFCDRHGNGVVVDLKSWSRRRTSTQLQEYGAAAQLAGLPIVYAGYYHARKGELEGPHPIKWTPARFKAYVETARLGIESQYFLPTVGDHCSWCSVAKNCEFAP